MHQVVFSRAIVSDLIANSHSYDKGATEQLLLDIEKTAIKNQDERTVIKVGITQLILCTMDDVVEAIDGDKDDSP